MKTKNKWLIFLLNEITISCMALFVTGVTIFLAYIFGYPNDIFPIIGVIVYAYMSLKLQNIPLFEESKKESIELEEELEGGYY